MCKKSTLSTVDGFTWLLRSWIQHRRSLARNRKTRNRPALFRRPTRTLIRHSTLFFTHFIQIVYPRVPVHDSGRDSPHYESLLVVEVRRQRTRRSRKFIISSGGTQILAVILYIILYYIDTYILFRYSAPGAANCREWTLIGCYVTSLRELTLIGIVGVVNPQAPKSHCLPFLGQEGTKLEIYVSVQLHIWLTFNTDSCIHLWNSPLIERISASDCCCRIRCHSEHCLDPRCGRGRLLQ